MRNAAKTRTQRGFNAKITRQFNADAVAPRRGKVNASSRPAGPQLANPEPLGRETEGSREDPTARPDPPS